MKKILLALVALLSLSGTTLAADFENGVSPDGCYYANDTKTLVFSRDASLTGEANQCNHVYLMSSQWYVKRNRIKMRDAYYNRIKAMLILQAQ